MRIDALQYCNYSEKIFRQWRWNRFFERYPQLIFKGTTAADVDAAHATGRTAVFFGFQNPSPIEDDIGLVEIVHQLGVRFMQLTYNNQSLLASGCYEPVDAGISRMGKEVIAEMNRVGLVVDMSHSGDRSTIEAADISSRPVVVTHANPHEWHPALRNKREDVMRAVFSSGGMIGFSLYPHHLRDKSDCTLESFCRMVADTAQKYGIEHIGIGSDLCQDQPDSVVEWMRVGRWTKKIDFGEGSSAAPGFPAQPDWFADSRGFNNLESGLAGVGFSQSEVNQVLGDNWHRFFRDNFSAIKP